MIWYYYSAFHHNDFIGKHFGCKVYSRDSQRWVYALKPTPELWSLALHTRTQIVDEVDCSVISFYLDIFPGCSVVESGTGTPAFVEIAVWFHLYLNRIGMHDFIVGASSGSHWTHPYL